MCVCTLRSWELDPTHEKRKVVLTREFSWFPSLFIAVPDNPLTSETTRGILPSFIAVRDNPLTPETTRLLHVFQSTTFHPILHKIYLNGHLKIHQQEWESNVFFSICLSRKVMIFRTTLHTGFVTARNITKDSVDVTASSNRKHRIELL